MDRFGPLVWSLARRFSSNAADAEDAAQDVFIALWRVAGRFNPAIASEQTFVAMVARRRLIDRRRRMGRQPVVAELPEVADSEPLGPDEAERSEEAALAGQALAELRPEERRVIQLSIYNGLSHTEIASQLDLPIGTVKTHIRRGLVRVRELLGLARSQSNRRQPA